MAGEADLDPIDDLETDDLDLDTDTVEDDLPPEDGGGDDPAPEPEPELRRESRAARDIRRLREEVQTLRREREQPAPRPAPAPVDTAAEERAFRERLANMAPEEAILAVERRATERMGQQLSGMRLEMAQIRDENAFSSLVARNPVAARHADAVEAQFSRYTAQGLFVSRDVILKNILGEEALKRGPKAVARDGARAGARVAAARTSGTARQSTVSGSGRADPNSLEAIEARLRGVTLDKIS
jgi:hypothetical protein